MAVLKDHRNKRQTSGSVANLTEFMVTAASQTQHARHLKGEARGFYSRSLVKAAIRRDGSVEGLQLVLSDSERTDWESANPIPA